jgi:hypothetical protein
MSDALLRAEPDDLDPLSIHDVGHGHEQILQALAAGSRLAYSIIDWKFVVS